MMEYYIMSKFAKDVLDSSSHYYDLAKSFVEHMENGLRARLFGAPPASQKEAADDSEVDERASWREDMFW
jgi:hypothetical protein